MPAKIPSTIDRLRFRGRNVVYRTMFDVVSSHALGTVVDVGGGSLFARPEQFGIRADRWVLVEADRGAAPERCDTTVAVAISDGRELGIRTGCADVVLAIHVLEHTFDPYLMWTELVRVAKPGGKLIVMVPQTANLHHVPNHYQNLTRFWLVEAARRSGCATVDYRPLGGTWSTIASRLLLSVPTIFRLHGYSDSAISRRRSANLLAPLSAAMAALLTGVALAMRAADLPEEANNHLIVVQTPQSSAACVPDTGELP